MICMGYSAIAYTTVSDTKIVCDNITSITLSNDIIDRMFVTRDVSKAYADYVIGWNYDTIMSADFNGNLFAGNLLFALETVTSLRIKQRELNTFQWRTIYDIPIGSVEDLSFIKHYPYARGNTDYEFAIIPVVNETIEGNINITQCRSEFDTDFLIEKDNIIKIILNEDRNQQRNKESVTYNTLGSKYPIYVSNGEANYDSGSFTATFIYLNEDNCEFDINNGYLYQRKIDDFLTNGNKKIFKTFYGDMWMINVVGNIERDYPHWQCPIHTVNWEETGDYRSTTDMFENNFLDTNVENI